jgi:CDP-diacylglycerol--glycerol-3-phosphate 3-phosphatidyltransferase
VVREVPNLLTVMRLIAVPVMIACLLADNESEGQWRWIAWIVFVVAAATDALDGYLARRWEVVSSFGKLADPLADKALVLGALVVLAAQGETPWWPLIVVGVREAAVTIGRLAVARDVVIPASAGGKLKTALQVLAIFLLLIPSHTAWVDTAGWWVLVASVVVAVATGVDYAWRIGRVVVLHTAATSRRAKEHLAGRGPLAQESADAVGEGGHVT